MLIVNADDWGMDSGTTDRIHECLQAGLVSSTTAMMYMSDSERSARIAISSQYPVGLHINFTKPFDAPGIPSRYEEVQRDLAVYFGRSKFNRLFYNPLITRKIEYSFRAQLEEFERVYGRSPTHYDGHHHIHLCANMVFAGVIPKGSKVRRNFTFSASEKGVFNRWYRKHIDRVLMKKYVLTDFFYALNRHVNRQEMKEKLAEAKKIDIECMVHPGMENDYRFIMGAEFKGIVTVLPLGNYAMLKPLDSESPVANQKCHG